MKKIIVLSLAALGLFAGIARAQEVYNSSGKSGKARYRENEQKKGFDVNRLIVGGGFGGGFGNGVFSFQVSPVVGYRISDRFAAGVGLSYQYARLKNYRVLQDYNTGEVVYKSPRMSIVSPNVWGRVFVFDRLFVSAIGEFSQVTQTDYAWALSGGMNIEKVKLKYGMPSVLLGIGYAQPITNNASFIFMASYDVIQSATAKEVSDSRGNIYAVESPYARSLDIRLGLNIGF